MIDGRSTLFKIKCSARFPAHVAAPAGSGLGESRRIKVSGRLTAALFTGRIDTDQTKFGRELWRQRASLVPDRYFLADTFLKLPENGWCYCLRPYGGLAMI